MSQEAYMRGFVNRCLERGVDPDLLCKHAEAVASRDFKKQAGAGAIRRALSAVAGWAKRRVPFKGSMMKHPVRWGTGALLGGGATTATLGSNALFGRDKAIDGKSIVGAGLGGAAIGGGAVLGGILIGDIVAKRIREKRRQKALAQSIDNSAQETSQLPGIG